MNDRPWFTSLARLAMLNALALSLLSLQFLAPPAMVALIVVVPAIYALEARLLPARLWPLAGLTALILALLFFGLDTAAWATAYMLIGMVCGAGQRNGWPRAARIAATGLLGLALLAALIALFAALAQLDWVAMASAAQRVVGDLPLLPLALAGAAAWALLIGAGVDLMSGRIYARLRATQSGLVLTGEIE